MTLETFFAKFDLFADAPNAVAKMRELVLELAVEGKLVEQNKTDNDAAKLLARIRERNPSLTFERDSENSAFELESMPHTWALSTLGEVAQIVRGVSFPGSAKSDEKGDGHVACLRTASVQAEIDWSDLIFIPETFVSRSEQWVAPSDIMISMANSYELVGKVAIVRQVPQRATFGAFLAAIRPILIEPYFLLYVLRSPRMQAVFRGSSSQTTNIANISLGRMRPLPFPLPPLAEQKRIVAKVDELMKLCDRLEEQQKERAARHAALARASLFRFAKAPTPPSLDLIFHNSFAVPAADLRKTVLNLAVQGLIVPQDPSNEPATTLIERIRTRRMEMLRERMIKTPKPIAEIDESKRVHKIPPSWIWCRLGDVALDFRYGTSRKCSRESEGVPVLRIPNIRNGRIDSSDLKYTIMPSSEFEDLRLRDGDLLLVRSNGSESLVGRSAVVTQQDSGFAYAGYLVRARFPNDLTFTPYIHLALGTPNVRTQIEGPIRTTSGVKNINTTELSNLTFSLPPLAEQKKIVAKVDQLMTLVDHLEVQLADSRSAAENLMEAIVDQLTGQE